MTAGRGMPRALRATLAALALCLVAFCGWSAWEYSRGEDPLAFLGTSAFQTVADEGEGAPSIGPSPSEGDGQAQPAETPGSEGDADGTDADGTEAADEGDEAPSQAPAATGSGSGAATGSGSGGGAPAATGTATGDPAPSGASRPARITVTIVVDGTSAGANASSATLSLEQGSTVYDALASSGVAFDARQTGYGMYVSSIAGLAEKEHGGMSGWMYSVNGATPDVACSSYVLSDGDSIYWWYANVES